MSLSIFEFIGALEIFDAKVLLLALAVCVLTGLVKLAIPVKLRKYVTAIPFVLGVIVCAAFDFFFEGLNPFNNHTVSVGLQCGVAATIYYVVYEQFFKGEKGAQAALVTSLIAGLVKEGDVKVSVKSIVNILAEGGEDIPKKIYEVLRPIRQDGTTIEEIMVAVKSIANILNS